MLAVFLNELRLFTRDREAVLWLLIGPVLFITVVSAARYQSGERPPVLIPVVDDDQGPVARTFVKLLGAHAQVLETSRAEAEALVRDRGSAPAAIVFPEGLSKRYLKGFETEVLLLTDPAESVGVGRVKVALLLMGRDAAELADPTGAERFVVREQNLTGDRISRKSHEQNVPGFAIMFTLLAVAYGACAALHVDARSGTLHRLLVSPVGFGRILLAKLSFRLCVGTVQLLALLGWGWLAFGISLGSSPTAVVVMVVATAAVAVAIGALAAGLSGSLEQALPVTLGLVLPQAAVGGLWWPLYMEPEWMRSVAWLAPPTWAMRGLTEIVLRDRGLGSVAEPAGILSLQTTLLVALGIWLFRLRFASRGSAWKPRRGEVAGATP